MADMWEAEYAVDSEWAKRLIEGQFPDLAAARLRPVGEGFDNTAYLVNDAYLFRFPRRSLAVPLLETECRLLPDLAAIGLPLAIPRPVRFGQPAGDYPWPFAGYPFIAGALAEEIERPDWEASARKAGRFLRMLHDYPVDRARALGAADDAIARLDYEGRMAALERNLAEAEEKRLWQGRASVNALIAELRETAGLSEEPTVLVHGDLHVRNVLLGGDGVLTAVVDWGDAHIGSPAVDLSFAYGCLPPACRSAFFAIYGAVSRRTGLLARYRAVFTYLYLLLYGHDRSQPRLAATAERCLDHALAE